MNNVKQIPELSSGTVLLTHTNEVSHIYGTFGYNGSWNNDGNDISPINADDHWPFNWYLNEKRTLAFQTDDGNMYYFAPRLLNEIDGKGILSFDMLCNAKSSADLSKNTTTTNIAMLSASSLEYTAYGGIWTTNTSTSIVMSSRVLGSSDISFVNYGSLVNGNTARTLFYEYEDEKFTLDENGDSSFIVMNAKTKDEMPWINVIGLNLCCLRTSGGAGNVVSDVTIKEDEHDEGHIEKCLTTRLFPALCEANYGSQIAEDGAYNPQFSRAIKMKMDNTNDTSVSPEVKISIDNSFKDYIYVSDDAAGTIPLSPYDDDKNANSWYIHFRLENIYTAFESQDLDNTKDYLEFRVELDIIVPGDSIRLETPENTRVKVSYTIRIGLSKLTVEIPKLLHMHGYYAIRPALVYTGEYENGGVSGFKNTTLPLGFVLTYEGNSNVQYLVPQQHNADEYELQFVDGSATAYARSSMMLNVYSDLLPNGEVQLAYSEALNAASSNYLDITDYGYFGDWYEPLLNGKPNFRVLNHYIMGNSYSIRSSSDDIIYVDTTIQDFRNNSFVDHHYSALGPMTEKRIYDFPKLDSKETYSDGINADDGSEITKTEYPQCIKYTFDYDPKYIGVKNIYIFKYINYSNRTNVVAPISIVIYELYNTIENTLGLHSKLLDQIGKKLGSIKQTSKYFGYKYYDTRYYDRITKKLPEEDPDAVINEAVKGKLHIDLNTSDAINNNIMIIYDIDGDTYYDYIASSNNDCTSVGWIYKVNNNPNSYLYPNFHIDDSFNRKGDTTTYELIGNLYWGDNNDFVKKVGFEAADQTIDFIPIASNFTTKILIFNNDLNDSTKIYRNYLLHTTLPSVIGIFSVLHKGHYYATVDNTDNWFFACDAVLVVKIHNVSRYELTMDYDGSDDTSGSVVASPTTYSIFSSMHQNYETIEYSNWSDAGYMGLGYNGNDGTFGEIDAKIGRYNYLCKYKNTQSNYICCMYAKTDVMSNNDLMKLYDVESKVISNEMSYTESETFNVKVIFLAIKVKHIPDTVYKINDTYIGRITNSAHKPMTTNYNGDMYICIYNHNGSYVTYLMSKDGHYERVDSGIDKFYRESIFYYPLEYSTTENYTPTWSQCWIQYPDDRNSYLRGVSLSYTVPGSNSINLISGFTSSILTTYSTSLSPSYLQRGYMAYDNSSLSDSPDLKGNIIKFTAYTNATDTTGRSYEGGLTPDKRLNPANTTSSIQSDTIVLTMYNLDEDKTVIDTRDERNPYNYYMNIVKDPDFESFYLQLINGRYYPKNTPGFGIFKGTSAWGTSDYNTSPIVEHRMISPRWAMNGRVKLTSGYYGQMDFVGCACLYYCKDYISVNISDAEKNISNPYLNTATSNYWLEDKKLKDDLIDGEHIAYITPLSTTYVRISRSGNDVVNSGGNVSFNLTLVDTTQSIDMTRISLYYDNNNVENIQLTINQEASTENNLSAEITFQAPEGISGNVPFYVKYGDVLTSNVLYVIINGMLEITSYPSEVVRNRNITISGKISVTSPSSLDTSKLSLTTENEDSDIALINKTIDISTGEFTITFTESSTTDDNITYAVEYNDTALSLEDSCTIALFDNPIQIESCYLYQVDTGDIWTSYYQYYFAIDYRKIESDIQINTVTFSYNITYRSQTYGNGNDARYDKTNSESHNRIESAYISSLNNRRITEDYTIRVQIEVKFKDGSSFTYPSETTYAEATLQSSSPSPFPF